MKKNPFDLADVFVFTGLGLTAYGASLVYVPAAFIIPGIALFWLGVKG